LISDSKAGVDVADQQGKAIRRIDCDFASPYWPCASPEHLVLVVEPAQEEALLARIRTAGAIYAGTYSTVACGDFLAGPSHTLPTGGSGKSFSGIRADQFQRRTSIVRMSREAAERSLPHVQVFARVEGLDAHGRSLELRTLS